VEPIKRRESQHVDINGRRESQHVDTKGGNSNFYNKLRKPVLELKTLGSDTMLGIDNLYYLGAKGHNI
jgi:hypothetical protein